METCTVKGTNSHILQWNMISSYMLVHFSTRAQFRAIIGHSYCAWCGYVCVRLPVQEGGPNSHFLSDDYLLPHFPGLSLAGNLPQPSTFFQSIPGHSNWILWWVPTPFCPWIVSQDPNAGKWLARNSSPLSTSFHHLPGLSILYLGRSF